MPTLSPTMTPVVVTLAPTDSLVPPTLVPTPNPVPATAAPATTRPTRSPSPTPTTRPTAAPTSAPTPVPPTLGELVGQKLVIRMEGTTPSADLLARIRRGEIGGVILFGMNITTPEALIALTKALQQAATDGGRPPLLIATDQEGGAINRVTWAPPTMSAPEVGATGSVATASAQGAAAGSALRALGINVDLAPVADVPASASSFMYVQGRTFSFDATLTSTLSNAFAAGLESKGVAPTMKHFPGIGFALENTDSNVVTIDASAALLVPGMQPYRAAIKNGIPIVMLSNATYTGFDPANAAGWSAAIGEALLRKELGFRGVTITDSLTGNAVIRGIPQDELAVRAAIAGTDMLLVSGSEASTRTVYATLLATATAGMLSRASLDASYARILALKSGF